MKYDHQKIEKKWQKRWKEQKTFEPNLNSKKKKFYGLIEFPYPSGEGLHVGHPRPYIALDVIARKRRMEGFNVLYPIGWDAFGLPTENYAVKTGIHPKIVTKKNTDNFRRQIQSLGVSFDWSREINTTDPSYYKWTQWIFIQLFKHGLAYKAKMSINWCLSCKIGLANEEVIGDKCERCGGETEKREKDQWMLAITKYADRLDKDLNNVDFQEHIGQQQKNWIGKSEGASIFWPLKVPNQPNKHKVEIFTTRPETIFGATFVAISPELAKKWLDVGWQASADVKKFIAKTLQLKDKETLKEDPEKKGIDSGIVAINPSNGKETPVWITNYVLGNVGTGAIMGVPAHDDRDFDFAKKFNLPIVEVIKDNKLVNSQNYSGLSSEEASKKITRDFGRPITQYKLRDWVFSRQRYWGEPIPMVYCKNCAEKTGQGWVPINEQDLPLKLPEVKEYRPTENGDSPLAHLNKWLNVPCPVCGGKARRETDTMPNWAGSSWYYWGYLIAKDLKSSALISKQVKSSKFKNVVKKWLPVDWYNGGMEHTTLHLLYSRFWHKFLFDIGVLSTSEPYAKRTSHGLILAGKGEKMSKSKGNVVNPDEIVKNYGADTLRVYEMFMGPFGQAIAWSTESLMGARRFLDRVWKLQEKVEKKSKMEVSAVDLDQAIKKVGEDIEFMKFNTAISVLMILVNTFEKEKSLSRNSFEKFLLLLSPFAPHITEEIWENLGNKKTLSRELWPKYEADKLEKGEVSVVVQINGKVKGTVFADKKISEEDIVNLVKTNPRFSVLFRNKQIKKIFYAEGRAISFVL